MWIHYIENCTIWRTRWAPSVPPIIQELPMADALVSSNHIVSIKLAMPKAADFIQG